MVHDLNSKNLHINWLFLLQNPRNHIFGVFWGIIPKWDFFPKIQFRHEKFQKNPMNRFWENVFTYWLTDILVYWQWWNHRTPFHLKVQVQQIKKKQNEIYIIMAPMASIITKVQTSSIDWLYKMIINVYLMRYINFYLSL